MAIIGNKPPISLIIKDHVIRFVGLKSAASLEIKEYGERFVRPGIIHGGKIVDKESFQLLLDECVQDWGLLKRAVQFIVPDPYIIIRQIEIPIDLLEDEIKGYLYMELGTSIHLPFEDPVFDFIILEANNETRKLLLFAAPRAVVDEYEKVLEAVKLKPVAADVSPLSIYRLYHKLQQSSAEDHLLLVQFDTTMVNICIFNDDKPVFMRHLTMENDMNKWQPSIDGSSLQWEGDIEELSGELDQSLMEIDRIVSFYNSTLTHGNSNITKILLTGDHPDFSNIIAILKDRFEIDVDLIDEIKLKKSNKIDVSHNLYLPIGLALKEV